MSIDRKEYKRKWREANKEIIKQQKQEYYKINKEHILKESAEYYEANKDSVKKRHRKYNSENRDYMNEWERNERETNPLFKLSKNIRRLVQFSFTRKGIKKDSKTTKILGCSNQEFKEHIEKQFKSWMNWENYGAYKPNEKRTWNIDHIIPLDSAKTEGDIIRLNHYTNLRPLC